MIGSAAGTLTTVAFVPQVVRAWKTGSVEDLSLWMLLAFTTGVGLWVVYGVVTDAVPLIITNALTFSDGFVHHYLAGWVGHINVRMC